MKPAGKFSILFRSLGPGLLFAGAAIGGSHLVQSTRAGANYGLSLLAVVIFINILKYPFFQYAHRYVAATGESLLDGYHRLGRLTLGVFFILVVFSAIFNVAGITLITTGLATNLLGLDFLSNNLVAALVATLTLLVLFFGKYALLGKLMKYIVSVLAVVTIVTVVIAWQNPTEHVVEFIAPELWNRVGFGFIIALMGWMPAPIDVSVWPSLWMIEQRKLQKHPTTMREAMFDFHAGYISASVMAVCFLLLGAFLMYGTGESFSGSSVGFSHQLVEMYVRSLGTWTLPIILTVVFLTMWSTTLTVYDAYPRTIFHSLLLLFPKLESYRKRLLFIVTLLLTIIGLLVIYFLPANGFKVLIDTATILCFLMAPVFAWVNFRVVSADFMPLEHRPSRFLSLFSWVCLIFLSLLAVAYIISLML